MRLHVFIVHSGLTFQVCKAVIKQRGLSERDIVVLAGRGFVEQCKDLAPWVLDIEMFVGKMVPIGTGVLKRFMALRGFDRAVAGLLRHRRYHLYIPHSINPMYQLLASYRDCEGFSYVEEGLVAYRPAWEVREVIKDQVPQLPWAHRWIMKGRWDHDWPFDTRAEKSYGFSAESFGHTAMDRVVMDPEWEVSDELRERFSGGVICVLAPSRIVAQPRWSVEQFYSIMIPMSNILNGWGKPVFLRFHPDQKADERELIERIFTNALGDVGLVEDEIQIERICASADVLIVNGVSTVGLYAQMMGREVYTFLPLLQEMAPAFYASWERTKHNLSVHLRERDIRERSGSRMVE